MNFAELSLNELYTLEGGSAIDLGELIADIPVLYEAVKSFCSGFSDGWNSVE